MATMATMPPAREAVLRGPHRICFDAILATRMALCARGITRRERHADVAGLLAK
jgi:hypothetical protein